MPDREIEFTPEGGMQPGQSELGSQAQQMGERAEHRMRQAAESGRDKVAEKMHEMGDRIEHTGRNMEEQGGLRSNAGQVLDDTGQAIEDSARYVRSHDMVDMRDDLSGQIRQHPLLSMGVAVGAGYLISRIFD